MIRYVDPDPEHFGGDVYDMVFFPLDRANRPVPSLVAVLYRTQPAADRTVASVIFRRVYPPGFHGWFLAGDSMSAIDLENVDNPAWPEWFRQQLDRHATDQYLAWANVLARPLERLTLASDAVQAPDGRSQPTWFATLKFALTSERPLVRALRLPWLAALAATLLATSVAIARFAMTARVLWVSSQFGGEGTA